MRSIILLLTNIMLLAQPKFDYENYKIVVKQNREVSYTNSKDAYFYTTTHLDNNEMWFAGWNIAGVRIFNDYKLFADGKELKKSTSTVAVYPDKFIRNYENATENFSMIDSLHLIYISLMAKNAKQIGLKFDANILKYIKTENGIAFYAVKESNLFVGVTNRKTRNIKNKKDLVYSNSNDDAFIIVCGNSFDDVKAIINNNISKLDNLLLQRRNRISQIMENAYVASEDAKVNLAIPWLTATLNQLVTNQQGKGIYAGLPWFNQYWGRDMFISFVGTCLVSGDYQTAKEILISFAKFQNLDTSSKFYGRIPNRAQPTDIIYNTADGTPRFVISIYDYLRYTADYSILNQLYDNVKIAILGNIKHWVDDNGFITHDDADTWMDAKKDGKIPFSPRGIAANDIQALWYDMLSAAQFFANYKNDTDFANLCVNYKEKIKANFIKYYYSDDYKYLADRLDSNYKQDWKFRPNQLFALDLLSDTIIKANITRLCWERLTYPWGVASLWQEDPDFHPYHHCDWYFFDEAYHNGIVWLWLNGIMMQRMIEYGQYNTAYKLFDNMNYQAIVQGAVGSLAENADALPREGKNWAKRSGTFLQAWSNAEHLRIWYQYFLGFQPDLLNNTIYIKPSIPDNFNVLYTSVKISESNIKFYCMKDKDKKTLTYFYTGPERKLSIQLPFYEAVSFTIRNNEKIEVVYNNDIANFKLTTKEGQLTFDLKKIEKMKSSQNKMFEIFHNIDFVKPHLRKDLNIFKRINN